MNSSLPPARHPLRMTARHTSMPAIATAGNRTSDRFRAWTPNATPDTKNHVDAPGTKRDSRPSVEGRFASARASDASAAAVRNGSSAEGNSSASWNVNRPVNAARIAASHAARAPNHSRAAT